MDFFNLVGISAVLSLQGFVRGVFEGSQMNWLRKIEMIIME